MEFWRKLKLRWDSNVTVVAEDYTARTEQELTVQKGQHVRIIQKTLPHAPEWCLIRLLNEQQQQQQHSSSSTGLADLSLSKYIEGLVPSSILKTNKSSQSNVHLPPPLNLPIPTDGISVNLDEAKSRPLSSVFSSSKRKSSFRRILKNPNRRLSLKDTIAANKEIKTGLPADFLTTSTTILSTNGSDGISLNKQDSLSSTTTTARIKAFTFTNFDDLTSFPDDTTSTPSPFNSHMTSANPESCLLDLSNMTESSASTTATAAAPPLLPPPLSSEHSPSIDLQNELFVSSTSSSGNNAPINVVTSLQANDFQVPTVLSVNHEETSESNPPVSTPISTDEPVDDRTKYGNKRRHNILELIETEKEYVKDLALIVEGYMNIIENDRDIKKPTGLNGRERVVFGNVQRIYEFHRDTFLPQLEQCIETPDILGRLFTTNRFNPYVRYCENKPRSEYIVSEYHDYFEEIRKKLGQKLLVSDLLIKPVQRIMRYQLLLREILRSTERMGDESRAIRSALQVMIDVPQQANDMMNVGRIKDLPSNVHQLGELKLQDMLAVSEPITKETKDVKEMEKKLKERRVFLFQQAMIFCEEIPAKDKYSSPNYNYKYELKINKLQHKEFKQNKEACQFNLVEFDAGNTRRVVCQCKDEEQYESWVTNVNKVLQRQNDLISALINPTAALQKDPRSK